ncbi:hypothetical protein SLS55_008044 [Diplodia seriata]|uniref:Uncharacterized protein n=1 Tax=Diplodia seriata TaxID=420778 RepID=A0ABR3C9C2_9PEZI
MTTLPCPLPQVEEALRPYIQARQETLRIRKTLAQHLQSQMHRTERQHGAESTSPITLQILLDALDRAADAEPDDNPLRRDDLRQWVKDRLGDAPVPPPEIAGGGNTAGHDASASAAAAAADQTKEHVLRLKKELLLAKQNRDAEMQRRAAVVQASTESSALSRGVEAQVRALRAARDELIAWIEAELAKMPEGDESILSGSGTPQRPDRRDDKDTGTDDDADSIQGQVDALYERYVAARTSLVVAADAAAASAKALNAPSTLPGSNQQSGGDDGESVGQKQQQPRLPPSAALPFIPALLRSANDERVIAQQIATHLRHQIAAAQEEARNTAQRLASESHLVGPDAESGGAWARAAMEATKETDEAISERVRAGEANVAGAKDILSELDRRKEGFRALRGEA